MDIKNKSQIKLPNAGKTTAETGETGETIVVKTNENSMHPAVNEKTAAKVAPTVSNETTLETLTAQVDALMEANKKLSETNASIIEQLDQRVMETAEVGYDKGKAEAEIEQAAANAVGIKEARYTWIASYPSLTVHITVDGAKDKDNNGQFRKISVPVLFKNGIYTTNDEKVAKALNEQCNRTGIPKLFRPSENLMATATISEGNKAKERMRNAVSGGIDTATGDNSQQVAMADAHINKLMEDAHRNAVITAADM